MDSMQHTGWILRAEDLHNTSDDNVTTVIARSGVDLQWVHEKVHRDLYSFLPIQTPLV